MLGLFKRKQEIIQEALWAYRSRLPDTLDVNIASSDDGGNVAIVSSIPGCMTQGESSEALYLLMS